MTKTELKRLEEELTQLVDERKRLGGYNADAATILALSATLLNVVKHLREQTPKLKK